MKKPDALFQLIKSMTRGEKRGFTILAQQTSGDKKYLKLFEVIDNLDEYDEQRILKKFKRDPKFEKQFPYNKNYLYNAILNSLAYFHKGHEAEMASITLHIRILLEKNLYHQAKKLLNKAKESALQLEKFEDLIKILSIESDILKVTENEKVLGAALHDVDFATKLAVDKLSNISAFRQLDNQAYVMALSRISARKEDEQGEAKQMLQHPLLQEESMALSNRARILFNEIHRRLAYFLDDHESALKYARQAVALYEGVPDIMEGYKSSYLKQYRLFAHHLVWIEGPEAALPSIARLKDVPVSTPAERVARFDLYYLYSLALIVGLGDRANEEFMQELALEYDALENDLAVSQRLLANYLLADYYVVHGEYSPALFWTNRFLNHPRTNLRTDLQAGMRLVNLLIHFELGNYDLMEYHLKSAYRYIYKQERMHRYERRFLRFFKEVLSAGGDASYVHLMESFRSDILEIMKDPFEERASQIFDVVAWLDSKLQGVSMAVTKRTIFFQTIKKKTSVPQAEGPTIRPPGEELEV
ncbi:MAG: hypothetical protein U0176_07095 [Bacteroidia bacterium]